MSEMLKGKSWRWTIRRQPSLIARIFQSKALVGAAVRQCSDPLKTCSGVSFPR